MSGDDLAEEDLEPPYLEGGKASLAVPSPQALRPLLEGLLGLDVVRVEHDALTFDAGQRLRVATGDSGCVVLKAPGAHLPSLKTEVERLGFNAGLSRGDTRLGIELCYLASLALES